MKINALGLVVVDIRQVDQTVVQLPSISGLIVFRIEELRDLVLLDLKNGLRIDDKEVDILTCRHVLDVSAILV